MIFNNSHKSAKMFLAFRCVMRTAVPDYVLLAAIIKNYGECYVAFSPFEVELSYGLNLAYELYMFWMPTTSWTPEKFISSQIVVEQLNDWEPFCFGRAFGPQNVPPKKRLAMLEKLKTDFQRKFCIPATTTRALEPLIWLVQFWNHSFFEATGYNTISQNVSTLQAQVMSSLVGDIFEVAVGDIHWLLPMMDENKNSLMASNDDMAGVLLHWTVSNYVEFLRGALGTAKDCNILLAQFAAISYTPKQTQFSTRAILITTKTNSETCPTGGTGKTVLLDCFRCACRGAIPKQNLLAQDVMAMGRTPSVVSKYQAKGFNVFPFDDLAVGLILGKSTATTETKRFFDGQFPFNGCRIVATSNVRLLADGIIGSTEKNVETARVAMKGRTIEESDVQPIMRRFQVFNIERTSDVRDIQWVEAFQQYYFLRLAFASFLRRLYERKPVLTQHLNARPGDDRVLQLDLFQKAETFQCRPANLTS
ncbi:hypothetical protein HDE_00848 [Halotydeus destructor]|nr:hypothetical protein HDE_00848 [Halotydeus destructor]